MEPEIEEQVYDYVPHSIEEEVRIYGLIVQHRKRLQKIEDLFLAKKLSTYQVEKLLEGEK